MNHACSATFVQKYDTYWVKLASDTVMATAGSTSTESLSTQPVGAGNTIHLARVLYWIPMICACGKWLNNISCSEPMVTNIIVSNR